ncbi:MAG: ABC transporter ATP-binding protein [Synechococcales bacterium]|nr:ABC transporter ATP-binding protein [Synechococcales bacterium]
MTQTPSTSSAMTSAPDSPDSREGAIAIHDLYFAYPDTDDVLKGISLTVQPGERVGIIGPNGAGKTTLFMALCGILVPTKGTVSLFGKPVVSGEFRPEIGLVFQNPDDQLFAASVRDDVAFGPENMGLEAAEVEARVTEALTLTGMGDRIDRPPHHLSGGEKRMVAIAGVLAMRPQLIIYDEPSANLDMRARRRLIQFLQQSPETMLISSHDLEFVLEVCDRVILISEGRAVANGNPKEIMGDVDLMLGHGLERPHSLVPHTEPHHEK